MDLKGIFMVAVLGCFVYEANMVVRDTGSFFKVTGNLTKITWAHAVNNRSLLEAALNSSVMMIEADVVLGELTPEGLQNMPIMAHPPANTSDLSLSEFLVQIISDNQNKTEVQWKGIKLDFKSIAALERSVEVIQEVYPQLDFPVWINADIIEGPVDATAEPVDPARFFNASASFTNCTLSVGWTTNLLPSQVGAYSSWNIRNMTSALDAAQVDEPLTFPVRAALAANSIPELASLLEEFDNSTITVWSGAEDAVDVEKLRELIFEVGLNRTYVDVPQELEEQLNLQNAPSSAAGLASLVWCVMGVLLNFI